MPADRVTWGGSLHSTFRILPESSPHLRVFLGSDGCTRTEVLGALPYDAARAEHPGQGPDDKRYRDSRQVYQTAGLLYESDDQRVRLTVLGEATRRWLPIMTEHNARVLGRHAAFALSACQLRNPTRAGQKYGVDMIVFPFAFIWRAMLALDGRISSDELNRALFAVRNEEHLQVAIEAIRRYRENGDLNLLGPETESGANKNDRIIPWMSIASFGWTIIRDKSAAGSQSYYTIPDATFSTLREAARVRHRHREFASVPEYVEYLATAAALPRDMR